MTAKKVEPERAVRDMGGVYTVLDPGGYLGVLPTAVINEGLPNAGIEVILTGPRMIQPRTR